MLALPIFIAAIVSFGIACAFLSMRRQPIMPTSNLIVHTRQPLPSPYYHTRRDGSLYQRMLDRA